MVSATKPISTYLLLLLSFSFIPSNSTDPTPSPWPLQFHSILFMNYSKGSLQMIDLWYDWPNGRNFNIIQNQLGKLLYDLEWNNGTSFFYTLDSNKECRSAQLEVGILRPNWLDGANYLGQKYVDGFLCNVWEKVDFVCKGSLQIIDLWYDWPNGRNFNIIQNQLGKLLYDLEWNNGTSFFYTLDSNKECRSAQLEVGILRPNWLDGANYLGQKYVDGFLCNVWEKVDFIWYYEDVLTKRPVHWVFYTGRAAHVMTFEVGAVLEDAKWQAPVYCFEKSGDQKNTELGSVVAGGSQENLVAGVLRGSMGL
ncbi:hypothetical protein HHK36_029410 [Tetracentron sinense]|uniref:Uncharacterized protein n=1 Tax=Tetracentron sinense TaxID=13715 RepID=A0A834YF57_TETSI|nr:hypothetical protein HHK36_029410 [Tetracentron sinense]